MKKYGHGAGYIPNDILEFISVDMGCIGENLDCSEYDVSICAKDTSGPYDYDITTKFINLAKKNNLKYAVDIYPHYSSDSTVAQRAANNIRTSVIGPGVFASHGYERSHYSSLENTIKLVLLYLT